VRLWLCLCLVLTGIAGLITPALADKVSDASGSVVRVIAAAETDGGDVEVSTGTGFALTATRILTNAHVVDSIYDASGFSDLQIVPSNGTRMLRARIIAFDRDKDLALLEADEGTFVPLTIYGGAFREGAKVIALGYPGNVDRLTGQNVVRPQAPVRSEGNFSNFRKAFGAEQLLHTANIAHGNSGGPLLDACGRVLGINTLVTDNQQGDSSFGFAVSFNELRSFLRREKQGFALAEDACRSPEEEARDTLLSDAEKARVAAKAEADTRRVTEEKQREELAAIQDQRDNRMALAALALVLSALGGAFAMVSHGKGEAGRTRLAGGAAAVLLAVAIGIFWSRPSLSGDLGAEASQRPTEAASANLASDGASSPAPTPSSSAAASAARLSCTVDEGRSDYYQTEPTPVGFTIDEAGCVNGRTQYVRSGNGAWQRVSVPKSEAVVSRLTWDPQTSSYENERWYPDEATMATARSSKEGLSSQACSIGAAERKALAGAQSAVMNAMQTRPDERLVYRCTRQ
jgi:hypothetical protein